MIFAGRWLCYQPSCEVWISAPPHSTYHHCDFDHISLPAKQVDWTLLYSDLCAIPYLCLHPGATTSL